MPDDAIARDLIAAWIGECSRRDSHFSRANVTTHGHSVSHPHRVFDLPRARLAERGALRASRSEVIRYLVHVGGRPFGAAELAVDRAGRAIRVLSTNHGQFVHSSHRAFLGLDSMDFLQSKTESRHIRILRISALGLLAVWLHDPGGREPILIPLEPCTNEYEPGRPYSEDEYFAIAAAIAIDRLAKEGSSSLP